MMATMNPLRAPWKCCCHRSWAPDCLNGAYEGNGTLAHRGSMGLYRDNGKENGNYHLGFGVLKIRPKP